jgi:hypothetical protein
MRGKQCEKGRISKGSTRGKQCEKGRVSKGSTRGKQCEKGRMRGGQMRGGRMRGKQCEQGRIAKGSTRGKQFDYLIATHMLVLDLHNLNIPLQTHLSRFNNYDDCRLIEVSQRCEWCNVRTSVPSG